MDSFWTLIGKVGLFVSAALGVLKLFEWLWERRNSLRCEYKILDYPLPPGVHEELKKIKEEKPGPGVEYIRNAWFKSLGVISGKIENNGKQPLDDVEIRVSGACLWELSDRGSGPQVFQSKESISLGKLKARERINFVVWCNRYDGFRDDNRVVVAHTKGLARMKAYRLVGPLGYRVEELWEILSPILFGVLMAIIALLVVLSLKRIIVKPPMQIPAAVTPASGQSSHQQ